MKELTSEIVEEKDEHQIFYTIGSGLTMTVTDLSKDSKGNDKAEDKLQIAILELFSSFAKELMEERGVSNNEKNQMNNILDNISQTDVINEFNRGMEKRTHRSNEEKLEILTSFVNAKKEDLSALNKKYKFTDIRVRVKLFRNQLLKKGFKEQLIERGISINDSENPKVGSNINK